MRPLLYSFLLYTFMSSEGRPKTVSRQLILTGDIRSHMFLQLQTFMVSDTTPTNNASMTVGPI